MNLFPRRNARALAPRPKRQAAIDEQSRYKAASLDHLQTKVADIRAKQEAELAALSAGEGRADYEQKAKMDIDAKSAADSQGRAAGHQCRRARSASASRL